MAENDIDLLKTLSNLHTQLYDKCKKYEGVTNAMKIHEFVEEALENEVVTGTYKMKSHYGTVRIDINKHLDNVNFSVRNTYSITEKKIDEFFQLLQRSFTIDVLGEKIFSIYSNEVDKWKHYPMVIHDAHASYHLQYDYVKQQFYIIRLAQSYMNMSVNYNNDLIYLIVCQIPISSLLIEKEFDSDFPDKTDDVKFVQIARPIAELFKTLRNPV